MGRVVSLGPLSSALEGESSPGAHRCVAVASRTFQKSVAGQGIPATEVEDISLDVSREAAGCERPVLGCGVFSTLQVINMLCLRLSVPSPLSEGSNLPSLLSAPLLPPNRVPV